jgi:O-antigen ligase
MRNIAWVLLVLFIFTIPWEYSLDFGAPLGNVARVLGLLVVSAAVLAIFGAGQLRRPPPLLWIAASLYLWSCCSFFWTQTPSDTLVKLRGYAQEMMIVGLIWEFAESPDDLRNLLRAWLAGSWVLALFTVASFVWADPTAADQIRFVASGQDPNDTARFLDFGFPIAALLFDGRERWPERILAAGYFPIGLAGVLLTASRSGFLVAVVAAAGCGVLLLQRSPKAVLAGAFALPALSGIIWAVAPPGTLDRLATTTDLLQNGDLNQRVNIWRAGRQAFLQAPILGHGAGSFVSASGLAPMDTAHNTALAVAVEGGLVALALALAIVILSIRSITRACGSLRVGLATLMAVWLVSSIVGTVGENRITWLLFGIIALSERFVDQQPHRLQLTFPSSMKRPDVFSLRTRSS